MISSKRDRRIKYTRMVLKDSLIALLKEKQISSITVKEICELADINRSTFYSHFSDPFDLLRQIEDELIEDMIMYLSKYNFEIEEESLQMTEKLVEYFASKADICQTLLNENVHHGFQDRVMEVAQRFIIQRWISLQHGQKDYSEYVSTFFISGSIHVLKCWLEKGMVESPREMAELVNHLINKGLSAIR